MRTITEHNSQVHEKIKMERKANVLCDDCKVEMFYKDVNMVLASCPPKKTVQCPQCHKLDYKII